MAQVTVEYGAWVVSDTLKKRDGTPAKVWQAGAQPVKLGVFEDGKFKFALPMHDAAAYATAREMLTLALAALPIGISPSGPIAQPAPVAPPAKPAPAKPVAPEVKRNILGQPIAPAPVAVNPAPAKPAPVAAPVAAPVKADWRAKLAAAKAPAAPAPVAAPVAPVAPAVSDADAWFASMGISL